MCRKYSNSECYFPIKKVVSFQFSNLIEFMMLVLEYVDDESKIVKIYECANELRIQRKTPSK